MLMLMGGSEIVTDAELIFLRILLPIFLMDGARLKKDLRPLELLVDDDEWVGVVLSVDDETDELEVVDDCARSTALSSVRRCSSKNSSTAASSFIDWRCSGSPQ
jgi:hypothetical protein